MSGEMTPISIPYPDAVERHLRIQMGPCKIVLEPGAGEGWVTGTYHDPSGQLPVRVGQEGGTVTVDHLRDVTRLVGFLSGVPTLELALGRLHPFALTVEAGGSDHRFKLGGLPLSRVVVRQGAGRSDIDFNASNPEPMAMLQVSAGAAGIHLRNLANANAAVMNFEGGAAGCTFDFSGLLQRDTYAKISTGVSSVEISVPATIAARIGSESMLSHVDVGDGFTRREGAFWTPAAMRGSLPVLRIDTAVALGMLTLRLTVQLPSPAPQGTSPQPA